MFNHGHELLTSIQQDAMLVIIMCDFMENNSFSKDLIGENIQVKENDIVILGNVTCQIKDYIS